MDLESRYQNDWDDSFFGDNAVDESPRPAYEVVRERRPPPRNDAEERPADTTEDQPKQLKFNLYE